MIWTMYTKKLKNIIQEKNVKILIVFDDMIADMINNKNQNSVI